MFKKIITTIFLMGVFVIFTSCTDSNLDKTDLNNKTGESEKGTEYDDFSFDDEIDYTFEEEYED